MENIIQQIVQELIKTIIKKAMSEKIHDIDALASDVENDCRAAAGEVIEAVMEEMNLQIRRDKAGRKEKGWILKDKERPRSLYTKLGALHFKRDYYYDKGNACHMFPLDHFAGVKRYERIGDTISAEMTNHAADVSYAKSADIVTGGEISRQTVRDHILKLEMPRISLPESKKKVKELHVYADEDHVHLQKPGKKRGKRSQMVPLVTVTEGTEALKGGRNMTVSPMHFVDEDLDTAELWREVEGYLAGSYEMGYLEKVYVHGDGGRWIKNGLEMFAQTEHVMDGYHFGRSLKKLAVKFPKRNVRETIGNAIMNDDRERAERYLCSLSEGESGEDTDSQKRIEAAADFRGYLFRNWESIKKLKTLGLPGSCTEAQVSHILSERFSRDPLGWSKKGLGKLSAVRIYKANGQKIKADDFKRGEDERYSEYADRVVQENMSSAFDWSIFDGEPFVFDRASGTQVLIDHMGTDHGVFMS